MIIGYWVIARKRNSAEEPNTGGFWVYCGATTGQWVPLSVAQSGAGKLKPFYYKNRKNANDAVKRLQVKMFATFTDFAWRGPVDVRSRKFVDQLGQNNGHSPVPAQLMLPHGGGGDL